MLSLCSVRYSYQLFWLPFNSTKYDEENNIDVVIRIYIFDFSGIFFRLDNYRNRNIETRSCRRQSQRFHHELIPGTVCRSKYPEWDVEFRVNDLGFRDEDMTIKKPAGVYRVLLVGDSFTEGESVAEPKTAANLAEKELTIETGRKTEVVNMGVMSYAPDALLSGD